MSADIVGFQQIAITLVFLGFLIGLLVFLKRKGSFIRANLHGDKRIKMLEVTAISPTEKLRVLEIDGQLFVMASTRGAQPVLMPLASTGRLGEPSSYKPAQPVDAAPVELTQAMNVPLSTSNQAQQLDEADVRAFQEKFKRWRQR